MSHVLHSLLISCASVAVSAAPLPQPTFYCTYDESSLPDFAAGAREVGLAAGDAILYEAETQWATTPQADLPAGKVGRAWEFDTGGKAYPLAGNFDPRQGTLSLWVQPQWEGSRTDLYATFFGCRNWGLVYKYTSQTYVTFGWIKEGGSFLYGATGHVDQWRPREWHHLAVAWDATGARERWTYLDGKLTGEQEIPSFSTPDSTFIVGASYGGINPARALIDEVAVFDRPLSAEQVAAVCARGQAGEPLFPGLSNRSGAQPVKPPPVGNRPPLPDGVDWALPPGPPITEWRRANACTGRKATASRERVSLNGVWRFDADGSDWHYLRVPGNWSPSQHFAVRDQTGQRVGKLGGTVLSDVRRAWYERTFELPAAWQGQRVILGLDSVRAIGEVFLNGEHLGRALEYERVEFDVTQRVRPGVNWLQIRIESLSDAADVRGIDEDVWIERRPRGPAIKWVSLRPEVAEGKLTAVVAVEGDDGGVLIQTTVRGARGRELARGEAMAAGPVTTVEIETPALAPWHPDRPLLHFADVKLVRAGEVIDAWWPIRFGYRRMEIRDGDFYLNGHPFHIRGQAAPPFGNWSFNAVEKTIREWMGQMRVVHVNAVREYAGNWGSGRRSQWRELYYDLADELGLILLSHLPSNRALIADFTRPPVPELCERRLADFVHRYGNHACAAMWFLNFNTGAHVGDIRPDLLDGSFDPRSLAEKKQWHDWMDFSEETLRRVDDSRPVFHHAAGNYGQALTAMAYLGFGIPLQEREEWPSAWAKKRHKPLMPVETGFPCLLSNYRERVGPLSAVYASEQLTPEYFAAYVGDRAYANLTEEEVRLMNPGPGDRMNAMKRTANYDEQKALFGKWTMRSWRTWGLSYCQHVEWRDCFTYQPWEVKLQSTDPRNFGVQLEDDSVNTQRRAGQTCLGEVAAVDNAPLLAYLAGPEDRFTAKDHLFFGGESLAKSVVLINDSPELATFAGAVTLGLGEEETSVHSFRQQVDLGEIRFVPFRLVVPRVAEPASARLSLQVTVDEQDLPPEELALRFYPRVAAQPAGRPVHLVDPVGRTAKVLAKLGVETQPDIGGKDSLLVIGRESLAAAREAIRAATVTERIRAGMNVLVFEQTGENLAGMPMDDPNCRRAFIQAPGHPLLAGLTDADLAHWRGQSDLTEPYPKTLRDAPLQWGEEFPRWSNQGVVCSFAPERPQRGAFRVLVAADYDLYLAPLLEWRMGTGRIVFCQLDVTSRVGADPVATLLVTRMLQYLGAPQDESIAQWANCAALLGGQETEALAEALGLTAGGNAEETILIGPDWRGDPEPILKRVGEGARAVVVANVDPTVTAAFLDTPVKQRKTYKVSVPAELRDRGVAPADFFWREVRTVLVPSTSPAEALTTEPPVVAVRPLGEGEVVWVGVSPLSFSDCRQRAKTLRLLSGLLHAEGATPDLAAEKATVGGAESVYAARQMNFNPYRYRRW